MIEPVSTGVALGAGWFANKLFGPSGDALGQALKSYGTLRLEKIFRSAAAKTHRGQVEAVAPEFVATFMQKASFSEDEDSLTEMWANLLAQAATDFTNRHAAYVEILSELTAFDARSIAELVPNETPFCAQTSMPVNLKVEMRAKLASEMKNISDTQPEAQIEFERLMKINLGWPGRVTAVRIHYQEDGVTRPISGGLPDQFASFDNLCRLGLLERFDLDNLMTPYETALEGVLVTMLGVGFVQTCRGRLLGSKASAR